MPQITFDLDSLEEIDALYLVDLLSEIIGSPDQLVYALREAAWHIADYMDRVHSETSTYDLADSIYPQEDGRMTWHQLKAKRNEHLRRFGLMTGE